MELGGETPMSGKNHIRAGGRLLQTDKKYSHLKLKQKERIAQWMYTETKKYYDSYEKAPEGIACDEIVERIYNKIEKAGIWIPYGEVHRHYRKRKTDIIKRIKRDNGQLIRRSSEQVCFMNMCMIQDEKGNVLALDKVNDSYIGTTFPGGHVERGESFAESVIREVQEETGLKIHNPILCGVYHWTKAGVRNVVFLYIAKDFDGTLTSSQEGHVYWITEEEFLKQELAVGMERVWKIMHSKDLTECYMHLEENGYVGTLS